MAKRKGKRAETAGARRRRLAEASAERWLKRKVRVTVHPRVRWTTGIPRPTKQPRPKPKPALSLALLAYRDKFAVAIAPALVTEFMRAWCPRPEFNGEPGAEPWMDYHDLAETLERVSLAFARRFSRLQDGREP